MGGVLRPVAREFAYSGAAGRNRQDA
jgi:hypothetical protein